jgi:hypothetical protein
MCPATKYIHWMLPRQGFFIPLGLVGLVSNYRPYNSKLGSGWRSVDPGADRR